MYVCNIKKVCEEINQKSRNICMYVCMYVCNIKKLCEEIKSKIKEYMYMEREGEGIRYES